MTKLQYVSIIASIWFVGYLSQSEDPLNKKILNYVSLSFTLVNLFLLFFG